MRMLVTRPEPDAQATIDRLAALDIEGVAEPLLTRQTLQFSLPPLSGFAAVAVTSTNALRALEDRGVLDQVLHLPVHAVGDRTAHEAKMLGFADVSSAGGTFEKLATSIALSRISGPVFYPAGRHLSGDLARALTPHGIMVVTTTVYDMVAETAFSPQRLAEIEAGAIGAVLFYSRRTAEVFCQLIDSQLSVSKRRDLALICLSENVAQPLLEHHFTRVHLADRPDEEAMMTLALAFAREQTGS
ncbi:uroporphyrinogen-III synthase [Devosia crocina]|uniref:Uroporphyrinogen-III synthase n=1 Tax=Devosia crocina TaxID=429728 RepID=A0A1I7NSH8_9HYPH|nr:uroporphyrinogen-III synthase [Devosia crocina]SFV37617.1 uroporphyrinogen-III synthase [Devosia crocina]